MTTTFYLAEYESKLKVNTNTHSAPDVDVAGGYYGEPTELCGMCTAAEADAQALILQGYHPDAPITKLEVTVLEAGVKTRAELLQMIAMLTDIVCQFGSITNIDTTEMRAGTDAMLLRELGK